MKNLRLTPLNIVCALLAVSGVWSVIVDQLAWKRIALGILLIVILIIADQFFRLFFQRIRRIWLVEMGFVVFTILVIWLIENQGSF
ncbi:MULTISPECIES: hypothetical protein [Olivibacter]|jgi:hypothetical protein|uniref:Uncharacterized protein n=2 Tax=Olivibacter TaxID=376469 RepID=A0ABV6HL09_9SPHI|nr:MULTISPECIES: hypothetical protein [Olivibacter]MCL4641163.1 hypothetical protein [Olivibacter sp. UJ_SKK_5.1]MDM8175619.1 hypothetical protein [Olivibacter sp. 47]MDX3914228.1 hypothetical protein [Pseudosphingobacterium sp.]QEL02361.1 hypothetical protein FKG96_16600 [Olivibacter sp. LS-1]